MPLLLLLLRLVLAVVFATAAVGKFLDRPGARRAFVEFGVPERLAPPLAFALPAGETVVALALLVPATVRLGALGALGLLLAFTGGIAYNLARGRHPDCHCFGQIYSAPAGPSTLIRNGSLSVLAGLLLWQGWNDPGPGLLDWMAGFSAAELLGLGVGLVGVVAAFTVGWFALGLARSLGRLQLTVDELQGQLNQSGAAAITPTGVVAPGLPIGRVAPAFDLADLQGVHVTLQSLVGPRPILLAFVDPECAPCRTLLPDLKRWQGGDALAIVPVSRGTRAANLRELRDQPLDGVLLQLDYEVASAYEVTGTPSAVIVGRDGHIASSVAAGPEAIRELVARAPREAHPTTPGAATTHSNGEHSHSHAATQSLAVPGGLAPAFTLPDLDGHSVKLADFRGKDTMLLFWNPTCSFCARIAPEVKQWAERAAGAKSALVLVALGSQEANAASDLGATILLDPTMEAFGLFGATGTPIAVTIDRRGKVSSPLAIGTDQVRDLATRVGLAAAPSPGTA